MPAIAWWPLILAVGFVASILGALAGLGGGFIAVPILAFHGDQAGMGRGRVAHHGLRQFRERLDSLLPARPHRLKSAWMMALTGDPAGDRWRVCRAPGQPARFRPAAWRRRRSSSPCTCCADPHGTASPRTGTAATGPCAIGSAANTGIRAYAVGFVAGRRSGGRYSSFFGVGGGLIMVPALMGVLRVPRTWRSRPPRSCCC